MAKRPELVQFADLTRAHFVSHPVWILCHTADYDEPWYDDTDEETFRPWLGSVPGSPEENIFLVRATLTLADGRTFSGFITPQHQDGALELGTIQPQMFLASGERCGFWDGMFKRDPGDRKFFYDALGADPQKIFPIRFKADPGLATGIVSGTIPGFCCCPKDEVEVYF